MIEQSSTTIPHTMMKSSTINTINHKTNQQHHQLHHHRVIPRGHSVSFYRTCNNILVGFCNTSSNLLQRIIAFVFTHGYNCMTNEMSVNHHEAILQMTLSSLQSTLVSCDDFETNRIRIPHNDDDVDSTLMSNTIAYNRSQSLFDRFGSFFLVHPHQQLDRLLSVHRDKITGSITTTTGPIIATSITTARTTHTPYGPATIEQAMTANYVIFIVHHLFNERLHLFVDKIITKLFTFNRSQLFDQIVQAIVSLILGCFPINNVNTSLNYAAPSSSSPPLSSPLPSSPLSSPSSLSDIQHFCLSNSIGILRCLMQVITACHAVDYSSISKRSTKNMTRIEKEDNRVNNYRMKSTMIIILLNRCSCLWQHPSLYRMPPKFCSIVLDCMKSLLNLVGTFHSKLVTAGPSLYHAMEMKLSTTIAMETTDKVFITNEGVVNFDVFDHNISDSSHEKSSTLSTPMTDSKQCKQTLHQSLESLLSFSVMSINIWSANTQMFFCI